MTLDSKRLGKLLALARQQEEKQARKLAQGINNKKQVEQRLQQLQQFHNEYVEKIEGAEQISIQQMLNHRGFLANIETAVSEQTIRNRSLENALKPQYEAWHRERNRRQSIEDSKSQAEQDERDLADQKEQRTLDDLAGRSGPGKKTPGNFHDEQG